MSLLPEADPDLRREQDAQVRPPNYAHVVRLRTKTEVPWRADGFDVAALDWPVGLNYITLAIPFVIAIGVLLQRGALFDPGIETLLVVIALLPWVAYVSRIEVPMAACTLIVCGAVFFLLRIATEDGRFEDISPFLLVALTSHVAAVGSLSQSLFALAVALVSMGVAISTVHMEAGEPGGWAHALPWYIGVTAGWCGGFFLQSQLRVMEKLKAAQADLARKAAAEERQRIAHEIHDVIAHSLTVTLLHVTGARKALQNDRADAVEALEEAERLGRQSLSDVRQVVGILKKQGESDTAALPDATDISTLVREVKAAGADVRLDTIGDVRTIAPTTGLALYRIVQESLTNVAKHAPGSPARVHLNVENGTVALSVSNPLPERSDGTDSLADGLGVWGMKERVQVLGGTFEAGPRDDRWVVEVTAPTSPA